MTFFAFRKPRHTAEPDRAPVAADPVLMRFLTLGGAMVTLTQSYADRFDFRCLGCDYGKGLSCFALDVARDRANKHAAECRAMPRAEVPR